MPAPIRTECFQDVPVRFTVQACEHGRVYRLLVSPDGLLP